MTLTDLGITSIAQVADSRGRIAGLVIDILEKRSVSKVISADEDLREIGLTSIDMVSLMLAVEGEFDLTIPESEMTPQNFRSVAAIDSLVAVLPRTR